MSWREFTFVEGNSRKFWNIELSENVVNVHFGRIGTSGRRQTTEFASPHKADAACERLIAEKLGKGYREAPAKLKETPTESLARTRYRVGQRWSFKTDVPNIHPVLQILGVEEHPSKGIFCFLDIKFRQAITEQRGSACDVTPGIELCLTAEALDRSLDQLVDARAPLPDHYLSTGEFSAAPESWLQDDWTDLGDWALEEAILRHLGTAFPAKVARKMGWPLRPKAAGEPRPPVPPEQEFPAVGPEDQARLTEAYAMAEAIARGKLQRIRALTAANPAAVNTPLRIDTGCRRTEPWRNDGSAAASFCRGPWQLGASKVRSDCPMNFVGAFPCWDEERLESLMDRGKYAQALTEINKAIELYPSGGDYRFQRGWIHENLGNYALAKADYEQAVRVDGDKHSLNNLAWILATAPAAEIRDADRAVQLALRACEVTRWKDPAFVDTLAAAYANSRQFEEAIVTLEKALALEKSKREKVLVDPLAKIVDDSRGDNSNRRNHHGKHS